MSPAPPTQDRLRRLLAMLPWLISTGGATLEELAARFGGSPARVERDLTLASMVGVPPYTPDALLEVIIDDDGNVTARAGRVFDRPPRLSAGEAFALVTAGKAILAVPGADPAGSLASGLRKVEAALGEWGPLHVDLDQPALLAAVRAAADDRRRLRVRYWSAWRDEVTERELDPYLVHSRSGRWYLDAHDHASGEVRQFRVDRIESTEPTGETFEAPRQPLEPMEFSAGPLATRVVLDLPAGARWVIESYPAEWEEDDGRLRVTLHVVGTAWLERLLLRVGAAARVLEPDELAGIGADAARRLLDDYESGR